MKIYFLLETAHYFLRLIQGLTGAYKVVSQYFMFFEETLMCILNVIAFRFSTSLLGFELVDFIVKGGNLCIQSFNFILVVLNFLVLSFDFRLVLFYFGLLLSQFSSMIRYKLLLNSNFSLMFGNFIHFISILLLELLNFSQEVITPFLKVLDVFQCPCMSIHFSLTGILHIIELLP